MILKETLKTIVKAQNRDLESSEYGVQRVLTKKIDLKVPFAIILSGIRRCGKSTLLRQVMKDENQYIYANLKHTGLNAKSVCGRSLAW